MLWLTIMLTVIASGFAFSMRSEALTARNALSLAQVRTAADGAIERTAFELSRPRYPGAWAADGQPHAWSDGDVAIVASAVDESAKIDINAAPDTLLKGLFEHVGGADPETAARIVDAILDWRDPDDLKRPNGAEEADYRAASLKQKPANAPFETASELARVMCVTPALYARIADSITVQLAPARRQREHGVARCAARVAGGHPGGRRRLPAAAQRRAGREAARARVCAGLGLRGRGGAGVAHPRRRDRCPMV